MIRCIDNQKRDVPHEPNGRGHQKREENLQSPTGHEIRDFNIIL